MSEPDHLEVAQRAFARADAFEREAAELRADLRRLRAGGRVAPVWPTRPALPEALPRIALETAFLIAAAVFVGVAGLGTAAIVLAMGAAWLVVCGLEWLAARERHAGDPLAEAPSYEQSLLEALRQIGRAHV
jgi:hypothetical protein